MLDGPSENFNVFVKLAETFVETFEKKVSSQNMRFSQNILSNLILSFTFSKDPLFSLLLTYNPIGVSCGRDFLLTQRSKLGGPFRYLEHVHKANRKFSRGH